MGVMNRSCSALKMCHGAGCLHLSATFFSNQEEFCAYTWNGKKKKKEEKVSEHDRNRQREEDTGKCHCLTKISVDEGQ